jgi:hypothetical protein
LFVFLGISCFVYFYSFLFFLVLSFVLTIFVLQRLQTLVSIRCMNTNQLLAQDKTNDK